MYDLQNCDLWTDSLVPNCSQFRDSSALIYIHMSENSWDSIWRHHISWVIATYTIFINRAILWSGITDLCSHYLAFMNIMFVSFLQHHSMWVKNIDDNNILHTHHCFFTIIMLAHDNPKSDIQKFHSSSCHDPRCNWLLLSCSVVVPHAATVLVWHINFFHKSQVMVIFSLRLQENRINRLKWV